jgi:hypothetical protein
MNLISSTKVWYGALPVAVPDGRLPELVRSLEIVKDPDAEPEILALDDEAVLVEEPELAVPVIVVPGSIIVGPGTWSVVGFVQGQSLITVGPGTIVVVSEMVIVSPPLHVTESG